MQDDSLWGYKVIKSESVITFLTSQRLIDTWPWYKRWAWLAWDFIKFPLAPILGLSLAVILFQLSFALIFGAVNH